MARMEVRRGTYGALVGKPQGIPLGRPRRKRGNTAEMDIKEIKWQSVGRIYVAHDRGQLRALLNTVINVDKKNQLDVTFYILYFSSNSCSTCFGQPCAHHQELTTA